MGDFKSDKMAEACLALGETIIDPSLWPQVMERICEAVGSTGSLLLQADVRTPDVPRTDSLGDLVSVYFRDGWQNRDPRAHRAVPLLLSGTRVFTDQDILTRDEIRSMQYFNECTLPMGFQWAAGVAFSAGEALWALCLHRASREQPFDTEDARILSTLPDRLTEVATLSTAVGRIALESATNALDLIHQPAIALDRFGIVLGVNSGAHGLLNGDLGVRNRRLTTTDRNAAASLQNLMDRLLVTPETAPFAAQPIVVRRTDNDPIILRVLPVHPVARNPFLGARVILTLSETQARPRLDQGLLRHLFSLTPAEAKLANLLAQGLSPDEAGEKLGVKRATARNQLKAIFAKTDTHRQGQLVALLASLSSR